MYDGKASGLQIVTGTEQLWLPGASQLNAEDPSGWESFDRESYSTLPLPAFGNRTRFERYYSRDNNTSNTNKNFLTGTMGSNNSSVALITYNGRPSNGGSYQEYYIRPVFCI